MAIMATGETGVDDGQHVRDAQDGGQQEVADVFQRVMDEDAARAEECHRLLVQLGGQTGTDA